jgi:hypothetical protein
MREIWTIIITQEFQRAIPKPKTLALLEGDIVPTHQVQYTTGPSTDGLHDEIDDSFGDEVSPVLSQSLQLTGRSRQYQFTGDMRGKSSHKLHPI